jgi:thiamine biosynthesis lipoprotein
MRILAIVSVVIFLQGCAGGPKEELQRYRESRFLMGTTVHVDVCVEPSNAGKIKLAYQQVWERLEDISWRMNVFDERSDVARINKAGLNPVAVGADTYYVLQKALDYTRLTKGAFDITVWPLIQMWKHSEQKNVFPSAAEIFEAKQKVGAGKIHLLGDNRVQLLREAVQIDLGGIAGGYAVDEAARILRENGITNFFIDDAGDIYTGGYNCERKPWRIGVGDPRDRSKMIDIIALSNASVTTSGNYEHYYAIQGKRLSHILNPITGYPQEEVVSVTMIAPTAIEADALATALCVLGTRLGTDLVNGLPQGYASLMIVLGEKGEIHRRMSRGYPGFRAQPKTKPSKLPGVRPP